MPDPGRFRVDILQWDEVHSLPGDWGAAQYRALLELAEIGPTEELADGDLHEMVLMALQDLELKDACDLTLRVVFGERLAAGVRQNLIDDLQDDRPWEQFADLTHQRGIFTSVVLLQQALPTRFGKPDAVRVRVGVKAREERARVLLRPPLPPSLVVRLLAGGMPDTAVLRRLYGEALAGASFPEATSIIWQVDPLPTDRENSDSRALEVHSSVQWLGPLQRADGFEVEAWPDTQVRATES